jgi:DNA-binding NarL/FixJ family response regulator
VAAALDILIVDDAPDFRLLVRIALGEAGGFNVVGEAGNGADAIELAERHQPAIVLLDVAMPEMDGLSALPRLLEVSPESKVVMLSGFGTHGLADRALNEGASAFLEKDTPLSELGDRLRAVVSS